MLEPPIPLRLMRRVVRMVSEYADRRIMRWHLSRAGVPGAPGIQSYTIPEELEALFRVASTLPTGARALEIGSHLGASTCYIAAGLLRVNGHLYCVDTWHNETMPEGEQDTLPEFKRNTAGLNGSLTVIRRRSDALTKEDLKLPLDFIFIDGDHSYACAKADFELTHPWLGPSGILAFHDCMYFQGVSQVIGEVLATRQWTVAGHVKNLLWIRRAKWRK